MATKNKNKSTLPTIFLPVAMLVASITKLVLCNIPAHVQYVFHSEAVSDHYWVMYYIFYFVGTASSLIIIALFALLCKGLSQKLLFVSCAFAGTMAYIFVPNKYYVYTILDYIIDAYYVPTDVITNIINISVVIGCFALSLVIATLLFNNLSKYKPSIENSSKSRKIQKILLPAGFAIAVIAVDLAFSTVEPFVTDSVSDYGVEYLVKLLWIFVEKLLCLGILFGSIFITKNKYKTLTCVGAILLGNYIASGGFWGAVGEIAVELLIASGVTALNSTVYLIVTLLEYACFIAFSVVVYALLNKTPKESICKAEE